MKKTNKNLLAVTAVAAALLLTGCASAETASAVRNLALNARSAQHNKPAETQEYDREDNTVEYEYTKDGVEYEVETDATTGEVKEVETEPAETKPEPEQKEKSEPKPQKTTKNVTLAEAKKIAYNHAGVNTNNLYDVSAELDDDVYEVEFSSKGTEYNYKVSKAGKVLSHYTEKDDDYVSPSKKASNITKAKAKSIALNHAGVSADSIRSYEIELDDGVYEISFEKGRTEYEYKINAKKGEVLRATKEKDD